MLCAAQQQTQYKTMQTSFGNILLCTSNVGSSSKSKKCCPGQYDGYNYKQNFKILLKWDVNVNMPLCTKFITAREGGGGWLGERKREEKSAGLATGRLTVLGCFPFSFIFSLLFCSEKVGNIPLLSLFISWLLILFVVQRQIHPSFPALSLSCTPS